MPGRVVPWSLGRLPWVPGAPPGSSQGGSRPQTTRTNSGHFHLSTLQIRIEIYDDFDVDFWSFWGRSWVPLGGHFRSSWRLGRPKLVPEPSSNRLIFEKVILREILRFPILLGSSGSHMAPPKRPRSLQDESLILLDRFLLFFFGSIFYRFRLRFRSFQEAQVDL